ncbi:MAG TPA: DNA integrity scanning diadenylate cyclase DisA [Gaiellaceae bacterium]|nr:DNA integrity scanning diadenylate cyclase DisA [Gaiellaceae bacterium]
MATDPRDTRETARSERPLGDLGFTRAPSDDDPRRDPDLLAAIAKVAPGTELRQAVDDVIRSHEGALIVVGDPNELAFLCSGGIRLDAPFRTQLLYELAKMDGAIIVDQAVRRLAWANVQLMPDATIHSDETGTRHRTAERVAKQTGALVVSVSQQRETVTVFVGPARYQLDPVADVLAKTNQALGTLDTYRQRLEQVLTRLTALEFQNAVVLDDVLVVLQRAEMTSRMADRITRDCVELGSEGRLIRLQLEELVGDVPAERDAIVRDYHAVAAGEDATRALVDLGELSYQELLEFGRLTELLGYERHVNPLDTSVAPRGYRILSHIPRLPDSVVRRVVSDLGSLDAVVRASQRDLEAVEGVGAVRAREIREGLRRLQEHNLVDRYLQL